jgi:ligand-binding SRPBCC domain-containing protein
MVTLEDAVVIAAPVERCIDLARSVEVHVLDNVHWGETARAIGGVTSGLPGLGDRVVWQARHFGMRHQLTSEITALERLFFQDTMVNGIFQSMQHDHFFRVLEDGTAEMRDVLRFAAPLSVVGTFLEILVLHRYMSSLLKERNAVIKRVAESDEWRRYLSE